MRQTIFRKISKYKKNVTFFYKTIFLWDVKKYILVIAFVKIRNYGIVSNSVVKGRQIFGKGKPISNRDFLQATSTNEKKHIFKGLRVYIWVKLNSIHVGKVNT